MLIQTFIFQIYIQASEVAQVTALIGFLNQYICTGLQGKRLCEIFVQTADCHGNHAKCTYYCNRFFTFIKLVGKHLFIACTLKQPRLSIQSCATVSVILIL
jgi:hypothetical protein